MLQNWLKNWNEKNVDGYLSYYDASFQPENGKTRENWESERRKNISKATHINVQMVNLKVTKQNDGSLLARFTELLDVDGHRKATEKQLDLVRSGKEWKIREEKILPSAVPQR